MTNSARTFLRIPVWLLQLWFVTSVLMVAWAYLAFPASELRLTLIESGAALTVIVVLARMGKFEKRA